jgi:methionyl-tRNA synthetase
MTEGIISFSDWSKIDLRVGKIVNIEDIEGADKLYKLEVDVGPEIGKRIICAGLKPYFSEKNLINKQIIIFINLEPRKMKGVESQGMLLAAVNSDESEIKLIQPEGEIEIGSRIR